MQYVYIGVPVGFEGLISIEWIASKGQIFIAGSLIIRKMEKNYS